MTRRVLRVVGTFCAPGGDAEGRAGEREGLLRAARGGPQRQPGAPPDGGGVRHLAPGGAPGGGRGHQGGGVPGGRGGEGGGRRGGGGACAGDDIPGGGAAGKQHTRAYRTANRGPAGR
eukprot:6160200-Pyramimonas_sp.AAC.1